MDLSKYINKIVYLENSWRAHSYYKDLCLNPPQGYEFIVRQGQQEKAYDIIAKANLSYLILREVVSKIVPLNLVKGYLEKFRKVPPDIELIYAVNHLVFRKEPWILDCEYVSIIIGGDDEHLHFKKTVEKSLRSPYCKGVICWHEMSKKTILQNLNCQGFEDKITVIPLAITPRKFAKAFDDKKVKIIFVNSSNKTGEFGYKGGMEVMETIAVLSKKFSNLEMVVRSDMPVIVMNKYKSIKGLRIIDKIIPREELEREFKTADIFLEPSYVTPYQAFLEAMSYELPIVTIDAWANSEIVDDGKTGFVCHKSNKLDYYTKTYLPKWSTHKFLKGIQSVDYSVVNEIVEKLSILITNSELRHKMGTAGRWEIEHGKFSIQNRNEKLKMVFDKATSK